MSKFKTRRTVLISVVGAAVAILALALFFHFIYPRLKESGVPRITTNPGFIKGFPWDLELLSRPPEFKWINRTDKVYSLIYQGLPYNGKPVEVFACYATPGSVSGDFSKDHNHNLPGIVFVHEGTGTAHPSIVKLWAARGYAAVSMDLDGQAPAYIKLNNSGPPAQSYMDFDWNYHAIAKIILAHSLILSFEEVDKNRTAIFGQSVGGHLTCMAAGIDNRFKAAASVHGTGFIHEKGFFKDWYESRLSPNEQRVWRDLLDPSNYIKNIRCPFLFIGNTNDEYYPLESLIRSYRLLTNRFYLYMDPSLRHHWKIGPFLRILAAFFDQEINEGPSLPKIQTPEIIKDKIISQSSDLQIDRPAFLYYTTDGGSFNQCTWQLLGARVEANRIIADLPSADTAACFFNYYPVDDAAVSSEVLILKDSFLPQSSNE